MLKPSLAIHYVWGDESITELRVCATDGEYSGVTHIYTSHDFAAQLAGRLREFPRSAVQVEEAINGELNGYSYVRLCFRRLNGTGHLRVEIEMEKSAHQHGAQDFRPRVKLSFLIGAAALDEFVAGLRALGQMRKGSVTLLGYGA